MTKSRIFLRAMIAFVAGVAARSFVPVPYFLILVAGLGAGMAMAAGMMRKQKRSAAYGFFLLAFLLGVVRFDMAEHGRPDLSRVYGRAATTQGVVVEEPAMSEKAQRLKIKITSIDNHPSGQSFFVLATTRKYPAYALGDELKIAGVVERPENFSDFDYASYLARQDIFAVMAYPKIEKISEGKGSRLLLILSRLKRGFEENIDAALPEPHAAFMKGLLLGERASLPSYLTEDFKRAGVSHIVALSGYNITIVGRSITDTLLFLTVPFAVSFWIATAAIILFVLMTGAAASVVRAGIMGIMVLLAQKEGRSYHLANALVFAGAAMIFHNPFILRFDAGFQLSFLATMGLVYLSPAVERRIVAFLGPWNRHPRIFPFRQIFIETMSAQIMVLPLLIFLFGRVSLVSPLANLAVLIAVPYSMAVGFAAGAVGFLSVTLGSVVGWAAWVLLEYQLRVISFFARLPAASRETAVWLAAPLLMVYGVIFWRVWKKSKHTEK